MEVINIFLRCVSTFYSMMYLLVPVCMFMLSCSDVESSNIHGEGKMGEHLTSMPSSVRSAQSGLEFSLIAPGVINMDDVVMHKSDSQDNRDHGIKSLGVLRVSKAMYMCTTEVTNAQYLAFVQDTGFKGEPQSDSYLMHLRYPDYVDLRKDEHPVVYVSYYDALEYCKWLSEKDDRKYKIPSEVQWEYACRRGSEYGLDDMEKDIEEFIWYRDNSGGKTNPVGSKRANRVGLYDMRGNVWEWTSTRFTDDLVDEMVQDGVFEKGPVYHIRGGSWVNSQKSCSCGVRWAGWPPGERSAATGFRLMFEVE